MCGLVFVVFNEVCVWVDYGIHDMHRMTASVVKVDVAICRFIVQSC